MTLDPNATYYLGLDIGGTKCSVVLGDEKLKVLKKSKFDTRPERGPEVILAEFEQHIQDILNGNPGIRPVCIGISCGGPLDSKKGLIQSPPNLPGWDNIPITNRLRSRFGIPVLLQNDANACALAEWMLGAGKGTENMVFLTFGTGMGAGLILNGRLYSGTNDLAGEVGHLRLADDGPVGFGKSGSFEGFCSGGGMARMARNVIGEKLRQGIHVAFCPTADDLDTLSAKRIFEAAYQGDNTAMDLVQVTAKYLGRGLATIVDTLNPECIVIGSIYARNEVLLKPMVYKELRAEAIPAALEACRIRPASLGDDIGDFAALGVAVNGFRE